jgi:serine/threonine-protein kinase RsbW
MVEEMVMMSETTEEFSVHDLSRVRRLVTRAGRLVGLTVAAIDNLVTAVNEIAVNAVKYAGGRGRLTIRTGPETVSVEVSDQGPGLPDGIVDRLPDPGAIGGRGLWMAKRMCSRMTIDSSRSGVTVRLVAIAS